MLEDTFVRFSSFDDDFFIREFTRTRNNAQIDGVFMARQASTERDIRFVCECKNKSDDIDADELGKILSRIERNSCKFALIVCKKAVQNPTMASKFAKTCMEKNLHVYRLSFDEQSSIFVLKPYLPVSSYQLPETDLPLTIIILETLVFGRFDG